MAMGSADERYRTDYTYDARYGQLLTRTSRPDAQTTVVERNTLSANGKNIISTQIHYVNLYTPNITQAEYIQGQERSLINKLLGGSAKKLVASLW